MILYPGSTTPVERSFDVSATGITVVAKDFNGLTIPTTTAINVGSGLWRTTLSIPAGAPVCSPDSGYYTLIWTHNGNTIEQEFQVVAYEEGTQRPPAAAFGVTGISLSDEIFLPLGTTNVKCEILSAVDGSLLLANNTGNVVINSVSSPTLDSPGSVKASVEFVSPNISVGEYVAHWTYDIGGATQHEYRQAFVISIKSSSMLSNITMYLDQSGITRWISHYQFSNVELVDCMYRAADRINSHPPQVTNYSPDTIPPGLTHPLRVAAIWEMLSRLYLAEGLSTFDFQGGSIQVNVDRTQFLQTKMDELNSWLDANLTQIKSVNLAKRSVGHLHITVSSGGVNNNYGGRGRLQNPNAFALVRQAGYNFL